MTFLIVCTLAHSSHKKQLHSVVSSIGWRNFLILHSLILRHFPLFSRSKRKINKWPIKSKAISAKCLDEVSNPKSKRIIIPNVKFLGFYDTLCELVFTMKDSS